MKKLFCAAVSLALGGCVIGSGTIYHIDDPHLFFSYAAQRTGVPIMVVGDPYPGGRSAVESAAVAALSSNYPSLARGFSTVPVAAGESTKVVLMFNPPGNPDPSVACLRPDSIRTAASGPRTTVGAVYCGVGPYSEAWMTFDTPPGPDSPQFRQQLSALFFEAIPRHRRPERDKDSLPPT